MHALALGAHTEVAMHRYLPRNLAPLFLGVLSLGMVLAAAPVRAGIAVGVSISVAPPPLPVYEQPPVPGPGYLWSPGYWAWGGDDYYWVPGTWVLVPEPGYLWTPGYWGWGDGSYLWHEGYWGPHVGFYGGVDYGFGYPGAGYAGGYWRGGAFYYNRSVNNIPQNVHITNIYSRTVVNNVTVNRVSYNGGTGGTAARPTASDAAYEHERHLPPVADQVRHAQMARSEPALHASANHGVPSIAATARPASFTGPGVVHARGGAASAAHTGSPGGRGASHPSGPAPSGTAPSGTAPRAPVAQPGVHTFRPQVPGGAPGGAPSEPAHAAPHSEQPAPQHVPPPRTNGANGEHGREPEH